MMTTNYDDDVDPNLDWNTERKTSYKRSLPSPWMAPPVHWTLHTLSTINMQTCRMVATMLLHCLYNQHACTWCLVGGWLLLCSTSSQTMSRKKHTAQWHRVWSNHKSTHNKHNKIHQSLSCLHFCAQIYASVDTFKIDRIWLLRALALLHWSRSVAGPK